MNQLFDKHLTPNLIAVLIVALSFMFDDPLSDALRQIGLFALSGAITNWLAVHMLFERVPGLYGSGVIPAQFEAFKSSLEDLVTEQLFTKAGVEQVLEGDDPSSGAQALDLQPALIALDLDVAFDQLLDVIKASSFGSMLGMIGGIGALEPLRAPFKERMQTYLKDVVESPSFQKVLRGQLTSMQTSDAFIEKIRAVVRRRLDELTPEMVKDIVKQMIKSHLGWLVVWGAVFGGLIGLLSFLIF